MNLPKVIMFVGPDNTGKTEIAKELAKQLNFAYFKNKKEHSFFLKDYFKYAVLFETTYLLSFLNQVELKKNGLILDRSIPCEYAYAKTFNRESNFEHLWKFDEEFGRLGAIIIFCYKTKYKKYYDELVDKKFVTKLEEYYREYFRLSKMKHFEIDTSDENLTKQISIIRKFLDKNI